MFSQHLFHCRFKNPDITCCHCHTNWLYDNNLCSLKIAFVIHLYSFIIHVFIFNNQKKRKFDRVAIFRILLSLYNSTNSQSGSFINPVNKLASKFIAALSKYEKTNKQINKTNNTEKHKQIKYFSYEIIKCKINMLVSFCAL